MDAPNPYIVLNVERTADELTIRRAYRRLVLLHHPDRNPGDETASERFLRVRTAYEILSDAERRALFDEFGRASLERGFDPHRARRERAAGTGSGSSASPPRSESAGERPRASRPRPPPPPPPRPAAQEPSTGPRPTWRVEVRIGPRLARYGGRWRSQITHPVDCPRCAATGRFGRECGTCRGHRSVLVTRSAACAPCHGVGLIGTMVRCGTCGGTGMRRSGRCKPCDGAGVVVSRSTCVTCGGRGINITRAEERCSVCAGTGLGPCSRCDGSGRVWKTRVVSLEVPAGVTTGATYRYQSAGHENENGVRADLLVEFTVLARAPRR